jgi:hypothetical protein
MATEPKPSRKLPIDAGNPDVPAFGCIVYVKSIENGAAARVANLAGIMVRASTERDCLAQIVPQFKQRVKEYLESDQPIPWVDPPAPIEAGEQKRFLPVHL